MSDSSDLSKLLPDKDKRRFLILRVMKADAEQVAEVLSWGADPNWRTVGGMPALVRLVTNHTVRADVAAVLLRAGADPRATGPDGLTALEHARARLKQWEGKPRKTPRRSPTLTAGGEMRLPEVEWRHIAKLEEIHPGAEEMYLRERRKAAERVLDNRGELEKVVEMLERAEKLGG